jgi:hypothetical protein
MTSGASLNTSTMNQKSRLLFIIGAAAASFLLNCFVGCAPVQPSLPLAASHVALDQSVANAQSDQHRAVVEAAKLAASDKNPADHQEIVDLQSTINDLGGKLNAVTGQVQWYEVQYAKTYNDDSDTHVNLIHAIDYGNNEHKAHVAADKRADVVIYAFAIWAAFIAVGLWGETVGRLLKSCPIGPIAAVAVAAPVIVFVAAFSAAYAFAYYVLTWLGQFLPDFSGAIPSIGHLFHRL